MRQRERVLQSLETVYRDAFEGARERGDRAEMARLDLDYQRDQLHLELLLDIRELLSTPAPAAASKEREGGSSILEKAQSLRKLTKLPRGIR
jgi:hypothetical protein